jgi:hypothetical protein
MNFTSIVREAVNNWLTSGAEEEFQMYISEAWELEEGDAESLASSFIASDIFEDFVNGLTMDLASYIEQNAVLEVRFLD